jgi:hypothetical protein
VVALVAYVHVALWLLVLATASLLTSRLRTLFADYQMRPPWFTDLSVTAVETLVLSPPFVAALVAASDLGVVLFLHLRPVEGWWRVAWSVAVVTALLFASLWLELAWMLAHEKLLQGLRR